MCSTTDSHNSINAQDEIEEMKTVSDEEDCSSGEEYYGSDDSIHLKGEERIMQQGHALHQQKSQQPQVSSMSPRKVENAEIRANPMAFLEQQMTKMQRRQMALEEQQDSLSEEDGLSEDSKECDRQEREDEQEIKLTLQPIIRPTAPSTAGLSFIQQQIQTMAQVQASLVEAQAQPQANESHSAKSAAGIPRATLAQIQASGPASTASQEKGLSFVQNTEPAEGSLSEGSTHFSNEESTETEDDLYDSNGLCDLDIDESSDMDESGGEHQESQAYMFRMEHRKQGVGPNLKHRQSHAISQASQAQQAPTQTAVGMSFIRQPMQAMTQTQAGLDTQETAVEQQVQAPLQSAVYPPSQGGLTFVQQQMKAMAQTQAALDARAQQTTRQQQMPVPARPVSRSDRLSLIQQQLQARIPTQSAQVEFCEDDSTGSHFDRSESSDEEMQGVAQSQATQDIQNQQRARQQHPPEPSHLAARPPSHGGLSFIQQQMSPMAQTEGPFGKPVEQPVETPSQPVVCPATEGALSFIQRQMQAMAQSQAALHKQNQRIPCKKQTTAASQTPVQPPSQGGLSLIQKHMQAMAQTDAALVEPSDEDSSSESDFDSSEYFSSSDEDGEEPKLPPFQNQASNVSIQHQMKAIQSTQAVMSRQRQGNNGVGSRTNLQQFLCRSQVRHVSEENDVANVVNSIDDDDTVRAGIPYLRQSRSVEGARSSGEEQSVPQSECDTAEIVDDSDLDSNYTSDEYTIETDGSDWSSDDEEEYADLMADLMEGKRGPVARPMPSHASIQPFQETPAAAASPIGLPPVSQGDAEDAPNPMEGLAMLQNIRKDLEQVGRMIVKQKEGEKFLRRAHILASINWLATNIPSCVLDHLGQEIREGIKTKAEKAREFIAAARRDSITNSSFDVQMTDDSSAASDLSDIHMDESEQSYGDSSSRCYETSTSDEALARKRDTRQGSLARTASFESNTTCTRNRGVDRNFSMGMKSMLSLAASNIASEAVAASPPARVLPCVSYFECALLFIDISGFTELSTKLDPENLSKAINSYFQLIVDQVFRFEGDIQKFAGDALFAEWRVTDIQSVNSCVDAAASCAASLVSACADFPVMAFGGIVEAAERQGSPITCLNVHCGLGVGSMAGIHIGDSADRREYVYLGNPICQATAACDKASLGQANASEEFIKVLRKLGRVGESIYERGGTIAERSECFIRNSSVKHIRNALSRGVTKHVDGLEDEALIEYRRLMSLYVHPVVVSNDVAAADDFKSSRLNSIAKERQVEESELRSVFVTFINPKVCTSLSGDSKEDKASAKLLNSIMLVVTRELKKYHGHLRQTILDDKGLVLIATFGLRGSTFPNLVSERALPATVVIHNSLLMELGVENKIGATFGDVYCGPVGGVRRNEYAVMGPSVNLAARLMCMEENSGILVDHAVRKLAARSYCFNALAPVKAKGYRDAVRIFEPLAAVERGWGRIEPNFVGRKKDIQQLITIARDITNSDEPAPRLVMISSCSGMGKTTMLSHSIEQIRKMMGNGRLMIAKNVGSESHSLVPFTTIRPILLKLLGKTDVLTDGHSIFSGRMSSASKRKCVTFDDETSISTYISEAMSQEPSVSVAINQLNQFAGEFQAAPEITDHVRRVVLEADSSELKSLSLSSRSAPASIGEMVLLIARVIRRCAEDLRLLLIALDDIHYTDAASWQVLREIFETGDNVLIVGANYATSDYTLHIDEGFANDLNNVYQKNGRFVNMELGPLNKEELKEMTLKTLGLRREDLDDELLEEVVVQSKGMPHFARKILDDIKDRTSPDVKMADTCAETDDSLVDIIMHRFDSLDIAVRNTLNVGAVMGDSFKLRDIISVLRESSDAKEADLRRQTVDSLKLAVKERILSVVDEKKDQNQVNTHVFHEGDEAAFGFCQSSWRPTLLRLMLDSRQHDVHRKIAQAMEKRMETEAVSLEFKAKLCRHWKASGDTSKASAIALAAGKMLAADPENVAMENNLCKETLKMWGWDTERGDAIAGFSPQVLDFVCKDDLNNMIRLLVSHGSALSKMQQHKDSVSVFQGALKVAESAKEGSSLEDRSIIFPAFTGLSTAIKEGHIQQDAFGRFEQNMLQRFLKETRIHGRLIHHIYALSLQMDFYCRRNALDKAIAVHSIIKQLYKPEKHSRLLRKVYGNDAGAMSFCLASHYQMVLGENRQAIRNCRNTIRDLIPKIYTDFNQSFSMMYALVFVLKDSGYAAEARGFFDKIVVEPFGERSRKSEDGFSLLSIYEPLTMLLDLSGKLELAEDKMDCYTQWAFKKDNLYFDPCMNIKLGRLGRCADSISAEICLLLAVNLAEGSHEHRRIVTNGTRVAMSASIFDRKHNLRVAQKQVHAIAAKLKVMGPKI